MALLEVLVILFLNHFFKSLDFLALVGSQRLDIDLLEHFFLDVVEVSADGGVVGFLILAFEGVSEVVDEVVAVELLFLGEFVEGADVLVSHPPFFVIVDENLFAEHDIHLFVVDDAGDFLGAFFAQHGQFLRHGGETGYIGEQDRAVQEAAKLLGWGRNTLTRKMKALHLD